LNVPLDKFKVDPLAATSKIRRVDSLGNRKQINLLKQQQAIGKSTANSSCVKRAITYIYGLKVDNKLTTKNRK